MLALKSGNARCSTVLRVGWLQTCTRPGVRTATDGRSHQLIQAALGDYPHHHLHGAAERKRHLFVRILIIAEEAEDDDILDGGEEGEEVNTGPEIDEAFIASLKEEDCMEKETMDEKEAIHNLAGWVCGACLTSAAGAAH